MGRWDATEDPSADDHDFEWFALADLDTRRGEIQAHFRERRLAGDELLGAFRRTAGPEGQPGRYVVFVWKPAD